MREGMTSYKLVTGPAAEPVTVAEMRAWLRISGAQDDALLGTLIATARQHIEQELNRAFITQSWIYLGNRAPARQIPFIGNSMDLVPALIPEYEGQGYSTDATMPVLNLLFPPLQTVEAITTYSLDDLATIEDEGKYNVIADVEPGAIFLKNGQSWTDRRPILGFQVEFTCGYGDTADDVPAIAKMGIMQFVARLYTNRGDSLGSIMADIMETVQPLWVP